MESLERASNRLIAREAQCLDRRAWDDWLALYEEDAVFWVPAWRNEDSRTEDPDREMSLLYYTGKPSLADCVWRLRSGRSLASEPMLRTTHLIGSVSVDPGDQTSIRARSCWSCFVYSPKSKRQHVFFGLCDYELGAHEGGLRISRKVVTLMNDCIPSLLDFYCV